MIAVGAEDEGLPANSTGEFLAIFVEIPVFADEGIVAAVGAENEILDGVLSGAACQLGCEGRLAVDDDCFFLCVVGSDETIMATGGGKRHFLIGDHVIVVLPIFGHQEILAVGSGEVNEL
jgi:hypothetical protein